MTHDRSPSHAATDTATQPSTETPLSFARLSFDRPFSAGAMLGARLLSPGGVLAGNGQDDPIRAALLVPERATVDAWFTDGQVSPGVSGCVHYRTDGHWLHGSAQVDASGGTGGLEQAAYRIYSDLFAALSSHGGMHLLRLWNYVPGINDEGHGLEHYRHFNIGRQRAFIDAGRSAFEGSPAACALGAQGGPLRVFFLAGRHAPLAIENPRQVSAYHYPDQYGPRSPTFSRAALADVGGARKALFISGTASILGHTSMHVGDVRRQTEETLLNIDAVLQAAREQAHVSLAVDAMSCTVYLRRPQDLKAVEDVLQQRWGAGSEAIRTLVVLQADICRADLLVEIEAHGFTATEGRK